MRRSPVLPPPPPPGVQAMVGEHTGDPEWGAHAAAILSGAQWKPPRAGGHDDKAHPPIHPTRYTPGEANWSHGEVHPPPPPPLHTAALWGPSTTCCL
jgi:hypothetical protein